MEWSFDFLGRLELPIQLPRLLNCIVEEDFGDCICLAGGQPWVLR